MNLPESTTDKWTIFRKKILANLISTTQDQQYSFTVIGSGETEVIVHGMASATESFREDEYIVQVDFSMLLRRCLARSKQIALVGELLPHLFHIVKFLHCTHSVLWNGRQGELLFHKSAVQHVCLPDPLLFCAACALVRSSGFFCRFRDRVVTCGIWMTGTW